MNIDKKDLIIETLKQHIQSSRKETLRLIHENETLRKKLNFKKPNKN